MRQGACFRIAFKKPEKRDIFFPGRGETSEEAISKFCFNCPVLKECENYADKHDIKTGIWGGVRRTRETHGTDL